MHADLSSYTCVFEDCDEMFFESRQKWWAHEMEAHKKKWGCGVCGLQRPSFTAMKEHLQVEHPDKVPVDQLEDVAFKFGRPLGHVNAVNCPLCDYAGVLVVGATRTERSHTSRLTGSFGISDAI